MGVIGSGQGRSKKEAEQAAAKAAVLALEGGAMKASRRNIVIAGAAGGAAGAAFLASKSARPWPRRQGEEVPCTVTAAWGGSSGRSAGWGPLFSVRSPAVRRRTARYGEALKTAAKAAGCPVTTQGSPAYVTAIGDLAAGAHGEASGWTYTVNGELVMDSCDTRTVQAGDQILWTYVTAWT